MNTLLDVRAVTKSYRQRDGSIFRAVDQASLTIHEGEAVGLVGESGSGKTTLGRLITCLERADEGSLIFSGEDLTSLKGRALRDARKGMQMIFQEPRSSFDPRLRLGQSMEEVIRGEVKDVSLRRELVVKQFQKVGLDERLLNSYPHEVSGGQCQRAAIARALLERPRFLIFDEATSALDVETQAEIVSLIRTIQEEEKLALLFISHNLPLVEEVCSRRYVMEAGRISDDCTGYYK